MISLDAYVRRGRHRLRRLAADPKAHLAVRILGCFLAGFLLSAASLGNAAQPFAMALVCVCTGWSAVVAALGSGLGYWLFWGIGQSSLWVFLALSVALLVGNRKIINHAPLLLPAVASLILALSGLLFQIWAQDDTAVGIYILRVVLAAGGAYLFDRAQRSREPVADWLCCGVGVLALAQIAPLPYLDLGVLAAGCIAIAGAFPAAAITGLALDLSQITPVPMTAVLCGSFLIRFLPRRSKSFSSTVPLVIYMLVMTLSDHWDLMPLPALLLGGVIGTFLPGPKKVAHRRGETGAAQVRLELAAGVLAQTEQILQEAPMVPVDEDALVVRAAEKACSGCPFRKSCKDSARIAKLPGFLLGKPLLTVEEIPINCRKSGRFLAELHRSQEQLRSIRADRQRQKEYRAAVTQQFRFLGEFLQDLSDQLSKRTDPQGICYQPQVQICSNRPAGENGDRCIRFAGTGGRYYVLLVDGMGTGPGAVQEGKTAGGILRKLLTAGYPAEYALRSLNSLCALRDRAGIVTVDLAELELDTGKGTIYKWGAAPSYVVTEIGAEKIGTAGPPPGLSVTDYRETSERLSLRRGETLLMVSDGIGEEEALHCCLKMAGQSPGEVASALLACGQLAGQDDATAIAIRLFPGSSSA